MDTTIVLIPSVLLGPVTWESTARVMQRLGQKVCRVSLREVSHAATPYWPAGLEAIIRAAGDGPVILVFHSNAGLFAPVAATRLGSQVRGIVFVDAALPGAGSYSHRDFLAGLVGPDGRLPPWTEWWDEAEVAVLFPNDQVRALVEAEQERLPLSYYDHLPPALDAWDQLPCAYLWFGEPYGQLADSARARGWVTKHVPGRHLHMLIDPDAVATSILLVSDPWRQDNPG